MITDSSRLDRISVVLHWTIALGILLMIPFGHNIEELKPSPEKWSLIANHKSIGLALLALALWRLLHHVRTGFLRRWVPTSGSSASWRQRSIGPYCFCRS